MLKKLLASILFAIFLLTTVSAPYAQAQGNWYNQSFEEWSTKVFDEGNPQEIFGERYTFAQVQWITYSLAAILAGSDMLKCAGLANEGTKKQFESCINNLGPVSVPETGNSEIHNLGSIFGLAFIADSLSSMRPASGVEYLAQTASNLHIIPETHAQGFGFQTLQPIQKIWRAFRNMAYALLVIVILVMAFMIMFRVKISPQTIITIQSSLPRIVLTLILVTFSYAIAGLIIDLSYLVLAIIAAFAKANGLAGNLTPPMDALELAQKMWGGVGAPIATIVLLVTLPLILILGLGGAGVGALLGTVTLPVIGTVAAGGLGLIVGILAFLIVFVIILYTIFRIIWTMLKALINIILLVIFGPILILIGGISPAVGGFGVWLKNLAANVAVFPTISILAFLAHLIYWSRDYAWYNLLREIPLINPFSIGPSVGPGSISLPMFSLGTVLFPIFAALGLLFIMPSAAELIKSIIQGQPFAYGTAIGEAFAPAKMAWGMTGAPVVGAWREYGGRQMLSGILGAVKRAPGLPQGIRDSAGNILQGMKKPRP